MTLNKAEKVTPPPRKADVSRVLDDRVSFRIGIGNILKTSLRGRNSEAIQLLDCRVGTKIPPSNNTPVILSEAKNFMKKEILRTNVLRMTGITPVAKKTVKYLVHSKRAAFTLAEVFSPHCAGRRKIAFTLAEVLITLGIIGVVAALTMPTLINKYKNQVYVTQLRKTYSEISQALVRYQYDNSLENFDPDDFVTNYFEIIKSCNNVVPCFANTYKTINNNTINIINSHSYILSNGTSVRILNLTQGKKIANIMIDTNGHKGPNKLGRDLFFIALYNTGQMDDYDYNDTIPISEERRERLFQQSCMKKQGYVSGWGCFGKILNDNWQMNY